MRFVDERIARVQTESLEIYNTTEITKRDYSDSVVTALSDDRSQRGESAGADHVDSTVQSGQTKTVPPNSIPSLSGFQVGATGKRLQGLENMVAELTRKVPGAEILNEHTKEADAGFVAAWNYIRNELGNSASIKSFSRVHFAEFVAKQSSNKATRGAGFDPDDCSKSDDYFNDDLSDMASSYAAEYVNIIDVVLDGICEGIGAESLVHIQDIMTTVTALRNRVRSLLYGLLRPFGMPALTKFCLELLLSVLEDSCRFSKARIVVGVRARHLNGLGYGEEVIPCCTIDEALDQLYRLGNLTAGMVRAVYLAFVFNLNSTRDTGQGTREFGYVNIAPIVEPLEQQSSDKLHGWCLRLRRFLTRETVYQECKNIKYHPEGAVVKLPKLPQYAALAYVVLVLVLALVVVVCDVGRRDNFCGQISDGVQVITVMLVSVSGIIKLVSEDHNILRHILLGVKVMKNSGEVQRYLGLNSEGEVKALLALVGPGCSWLENVNTGMLDEERHSGNIRMEDGCTLEELMRFNGRIIGDTIDWISSDGNELGIVMKKKVEKRFKLKLNKLVDTKHGTRSEAVHFSFFPQAVFSREAQDHHTSARRQGADTNSVHLLEVCLTEDLATCGAIEWHITIRRFCTPHVRHDPYNPHVFPRPHPMKSTSPPLSISPSNQSNMALLIDTNS